MNGTVLLELSDGEEMIVEGRTVRTVPSADPRDFAIEARRQAIEASNEIPPSQVRQ